MSHRSNFSLFHLALFLLNASNIMATPVSGIFDMEESSLIPRTVPKATKHLSDKVHGIAMGVAVILIFPLGSICWKVLDRLVSPRSLLKIHVFCQILGLGLFIAGFGVGVWVCVIHKEVYNDIYGHVVLGTILMALLILQPLLGQLHHYLYISPSRSVVPWLRLSHIWLGRLLMVAAIVNGATGVVLANNTPGGEKGYSAAAGIVGVFYIVIVLLWHWNRSKQPPGVHGEGPMAEERAELKSPSGTAVPINEK